MPSEQSRTSSYTDLRPSRSQLEALLGEITRESDTLQAVLDAFQEHGLLSRPENSRRPMDTNGRYSRADLIDALDSFSPALRDKVIAVLQKVGGVA
jgi:hypothetical protein